MKRFSLLAVAAVLASCSGGGTTLPAPPVSAPSAPSHTVSATLIPTSAFSSVTLPCQSEIDGLAVAPDGNAWVTQPFYCTAYVADSANTITRITPSGTVTVYHTPTTNSGPFSITLAGDSKLYADEASVGKLVQIDPGSGAMTEFTIPPDQGQAPNVRFVGTGPDGNVWFTDIGFGSTMGLGTFNVTTHQFAWYPLGMQIGLSSKPVTGPNGTLWVSNNNTNYHGTAPFGIYNQSGANIAQYHVPTPLGDLTLASDANVWYTEEQGPGGGSTQQSLALGRVTSSGTVTTFLLPSSNVHDAALTGIAQAHNGNIYAGLFNSNAIVQSTLNGTMTVYAFPASCDIVQPFLLAAGTGNTLWAADGGNTKRIYLLDLNQLH